MELTSLLSWEKNFQGTLLCHHVIRSNGDCKELSALNEGWFVTAYKCPSTCLFIESRLWWVTPHGGQPGVRNVHRYAGMLGIHCTIEFHGICGAVVIIGGLGVSITTR